MQVKAAGGELAAKRATCKHAIRLCRLFITWLDKATLLGIVSGSERTSMWKFILLQLEHVQLPVLAFFFFSLSFSAERLRGMQKKDLNEVVLV